MLLQLVILLVLIFFGVLIGAWYYYTWTPKGILEDAEATLTDHQKIAKAASTMVSISTTNAEVESTLTIIKNRPKFNPVKNVREHNEG